MSTSALTAASSPYEGERAVRELVNPIETEWGVPPASAAVETRREAEPASDATAMPVKDPRPPVQMTQAQLIENYAAIVRARAIFYPVAYQFLSELGRGRQGVVFLGLRQGRAAA